MIALVLVPIVAGCADDRPAENRQADQSISAPALRPTENTEAVPAVDRSTPQAAVAVLRDYFRLVGGRKFVEAHKLWTTDDNLSDGAFAGSFDRYRTYHGDVGAPGRIEGAAGSAYIEIPVTVTGTLASGEDFRQTGTFTLRRANNVPGATPEQLQWRIYKTDLRPRQVQGGFRFIGRWASEEGNCATRAWVFTASSLKTPAGSVCSFSQVREVPGGYDIAASCTAEGPPTDDRLRLRFAESARALLFESDVIADAGLVRCR